MLPTLQWYIFREMGKTFALAAIGLTCVLGLGGGVMNLIDLQEQVTPAQLFHLMIIVLPVAGTLTLPIAALYSATVTYGRLSADNELTACRASGINIHRLLLTPIMISLASAGATFYFISFMIPGMVHDLSNFARFDIRQIVEQRVQSPERLALPGGKFRIYADDCRTHPDDPSALLLTGVAFLGIEGDQWSRHGAAQSFVIRFKEIDGEPAISGAMYNGSYYDRKERRWFELASQEFQARKIPLHARLRVKWLDLGELLRYRLRPEDWPNVSEAVSRCRQAIFAERFYADVWRRLQDGGGVVRLSAGTDTLEVRVERASQNPRDGRLLLENVSVTIRGDRGTRTITGQQASLVVEHSDDGTSPKAALEITGRATVSREGDDESPVQRTRERIGGIEIPRKVFDEAQGISDARLLDRSQELSLRQEAGEARDHAVELCADFQRDINSELHSRMAFCASSLVLVLLGAGLGIVFRGAHVLTAFGISFVPSLFMIVMNIMGRQLAEKDGTEVVGISMIWGAIAVVAVLDVWTLTRAVRR